MANALSLAVNGDLTIRLTVEDRRALAALLGAMVNIDADIIYDQEAHHLLDTIYRLVRVEPPAPRQDDAAPYSWIKTKWHGEAKQGSDAKPLVEEVREGKFDQPHP